jgi:hypothetical protein
MYNMGAVFKLRAVDKEGQTHMIYIVGKIKSTLVVVLQTRALLVHKHVKKT